MSSGPPLATFLLRPKLCIVLCKMLRMVDPAVDQNTLSIEQIKHQNYFPKMGNWLDKLICAGLRNALWGGIFDMICVDEDWWLMRCILETCSDCNFPFLFSMISLLSTITTMHVDGNRFKQYLPNAVARLLIKTEKHFELSISFLLLGLNHQGSHHCLLLC